MKYGFNVFFVNSNIYLSSELILIEYSLFSCFDACLESFVWMLDIVHFIISSW